jgi:hypothetical protein
MFSQRRFTWISHQSTFAAIAHSRARPTLNKLQTLFVFSRCGNVQHRPRGERGRPPPFSAFPKSAFRIRLPTVSGQKPTLSRCGSDFSQQRRPMRLLWPAPVQFVPVLRDERVQILLSEVDLPRFGCSIHALSEVWHGLNLG